MTQTKDECLEYYMEHFQYNHQESRRAQLGKETVRTIIRREIQHESYEWLNLMGSRDLHQLKYDKICELCKRYSRVNAKNGRSSKDVSRFTKYCAGLGVTHT